MSSIKDFANKVKNQGAVSENQEPTAKVTPAPAKETNVNVSQQVEDSFFSRIKELIETEKNYNNKTIVYIDDDIAKILLMVKIETKLSMGNIVSYIVEEFIKENKDFINQIVIQNKYLSNGME